MKKIIITAIVAAMLVAFAGCSGADNKKVNANPSMSSSKEDSTKEETTPITEAATEAAKDKELTVGDTFEFDGFEITLGKDISFTKVDNEFADSHGADVIKIPVTLVNKDSESKSLNMFYCKIFNAEGKESENLFAYFSADDVSGETLRPNATSDDKFIHAVYTTDGDYYVEFSNFVDKVEVKVPVKK